MPIITTPAWRVATVALTLTLGFGSLAACGNDDSSSESTTTAAAAPEEHKAPMSEVLTGLGSIKETGAAAAEAAAAGDFDAALAGYDELHEVWEEVEGTVKDTDVDAYEAIETANGLIKDGAESDNAERVSQGATDLAAAIDAFIEANA